jgi:hypothetical protein
MVCKLRVNKYLIVLEMELITIIIKSLILVHDMIYYTKLFY